MYYVFICHAHRLLNIHHLRRKHHQSQTRVPSPGVHTAPVVQLVAVEAVVQNAMQTGRPASSASAAGLNPWALI